MNRTTLALLVSLALFVAFALADPLSAEQPATGDTTVKLTYVTMKDIADYLTPRHIRKLLTSALDLPNGKSRGIVCKVTEQFTEVDTDLDGKPDTKVAQSGKIVDVTIAEENGTKRKYPVVFWHDTSYDRNLETDPKSWYYGSASAVTGIIEGKKFLIIDDDCNGKYNDFGMDAIVIAPGKSGWYLTSVLELGKGLIELTVAADGSSASYHPFVSPTGTVDAVSKLSKAIFKPIVFAIKSENRTFNVIRPDGKLAMVPVGKYTVERAIVDRTIEVVGGTLPQFDVVQDATAKIEWGGPFTMLFNQSPDPDYPRAIYAADPDKHRFYCEPPYFKGEHGEVFVGSKDGCEPEQPLESDDPDAAQKFFFTAERASFTIEILDVKTRKAMNPTRFYSASQPSLGVGYPSHFFWLPYTWEYGDLRGNYLIRVTSPTSKAFKEAVYEEKIELK